MKVLFLDIDGVLNCHEVIPDGVGSSTLSRDHVKRLNKVLQQTGAKVVLSSAWRYLVHREEMTIEGLDWLLRSHGVLAGRLIGVTDPDTDTNPVYDGRPESWRVDGERGEQIARWVKQHAVQRYAVVDDLDLGITAHGHPFVRTRPSHGLTDEDADRLTALLK